MSVDLTLLPFDGGYELGDGTPFAYSHTLLGAGCDYGLHRAIKKLASQPIPARFSAYVARGSDGEPCYGDVAEDCYGQPLQSIPAGVLHQTAVKCGKADRPWCAYIGAMEPGVRVALYWH